MPTSTGHLTRVYVLHLWAPGGISWLVFPDPHHPAVFPDLNHQLLDLSTGSLAFERIAKNVCWNKWLMFKTNSWDKGESMLRARRKERGNTEMGERAGPFWADNTFTPIILLAGTIRYNVSLYRSVFIVFLTKAVKSCIAWFYAYPPFTLAQILRCGSWFFS